MMPHRVCLEPGCPEFASFRGRCVAHQRDRQRHIHRAGNRIYNTTKWKRTRERILFDHPLCQHDDGCSRIATDVHHITDLADGGDPYEMAGLQALCRQHHSQITRATQQRT